MIDLPTIALSVRQPWAWAIVEGGKDIENRSAAAVRHGMRPGRIAIHAARGMTRAEYADARDFMGRLDVICPRPDDLVRGAIIGAATVTSIVHHSDSPWWMGPRGLVLTEVVACDPIPAPGMLGYFRWQEGGETCEPNLWMRHQTPATSGGA